MSASNQFTLDWYLLQDDYAILSSGVLWTLDYLDTLPLEIDMFWSRFIRIGKSKAKDRDAEAADKAKNKGLGLLLMILFFIGRYFTMLYAYVRISYLQPGKVSDKFCADTSYPATVAFELAAMCTNTLLLMRAWVLCGHNKLVLLLGIVVILARFAYGSYINLALEVPAAGGGKRFQPKCSWIRPDDSNDTIFQRSQSVTPALALALDTLVLVAILTPTLQLILEKRKLGISNRSGLIERFVRDGVLYYIVVLTLAVCIAAATFSSITGMATESLDSLGQVVAPFFNLVPNMLASRIMLNAHTYHKSEHSSSLGSQPETFRGMEFAQTAGSIGAPLRTDWFSNVDEFHLEDGDSGTRVLDDSCDDGASSTTRGAASKDGAQVDTYSVHESSSSASMQQWSPGAESSATRFSDCEVGSLHGEEEVR